MSEIYGNDADDDDPTQMIKYIKTYVAACHAFHYYVMIYPSLHKTINLNEFIVIFKPKDGEYCPRHCPWGES